MYKYIALYSLVIISNIKHNPLLSISCLINKTRLLSWRVKLAIKIQRYKILFEIFESKCAICKKSANGERDREGNAIGPCFLHWFSGVIFLLFLFFFLSTCGP